eukprot:GEMP01014819.1.p1 GENE.GEMP01014819.1~~GEMP01014819.1.p1  ORF type:complete len:334 (+),score=79.71 GEMP01014819.1:33-1004(+)
MSDQDSTPRAQHDSSDEEGGNARADHGSDDDNRSQASSDSNSDSNSHRSDKSKSDRLSDDDDDRSNSSKDEPKKEFVVPEPPPPVPPPAVPEPPPAICPPPTPETPREAHFRKMAELDEHAAKFRDMAEDCLLDILGPAGSVGQMLKDKGICDPSPCLFHYKGSCRMGIKCKFTHEKPVGKPPGATPAPLGMSQPAPGGQPPLAGWAAPSDNRTVFRPATPPPFDPWATPMPGMPGMPGMLGMPGMPGVMPLQGQLLPPSKRHRSLAASLAAAQMPNSIPCWLLDEGDVGPSKYVPEWNIPPPLPPGRPGQLNFGGRGGNIYV